MSLTAKLRASIQFALGAAPDLGTAVAKFAGLPDVDLASGTGDWQASKAYVNSIQIAASGDTTLDLSALTDPLGVALSLTKVKAILVKAGAGNTNSVIMGAAGSNPFLGALGGTAPTVTVPPGGVAMLTAPKAGWTVSTAVNLKFANSSSGSAVDFDLLIIGT
jgi:hypothetical protein